MSSLGTGADIAFVEATLGLGYEPLGDQKVGHLTAKGCRSSCPPGWSQKAPSDSRAAGD